MKSPKNNLFKKFIVTIIGLLLFSVAIAQNKIVLKNGETIENIKLNEIKSEYIVYELNSSLHDLEIVKISYIINGTSNISFDKYNKPVYTKYPNKNNYTSPEETTGIDGSNKSRKYIIKFAPTALLDYDAGLQIGIENKINPAWTVQNEFSYLFGSGIDIEGFDNRKNVKGFAYKGEFRRYKLSRSADFKGFYWAPQFMYKQVAYDIWQETFSYDTLTSIETYHYWTTPIVKIVYAENFKLGYQYLAPSGFIFDSYLGAGMRTILFTKNKNFAEEHSSFPQGTLPNFTAGFKLGWIFKK